MKMRGQISDTIESHRFNLAGMKPGDWFLGCPSCFEQFPVKAAGATACKCGSRKLIYDIHHKDVAEIRQHDERAKK